MSVDDVVNTITKVMKQNGSKIINGGSNIKISGVVDGVKYKMSIVDGKIMQFFPF